MTEVASMKRSSGILNGNRLSHATLHDSSVRAARIPNFDAVERYMEFLAIEHGVLLDNEHNEIYEPIVIDLEKLILECDLPYKNINHFLMIITENGKYGEFESGTTSAHLTKQALFHLIKVLSENTQSFFLEKNLMDISDVQKKTNTVVLDKKTLTGLIVSRGLHSIAKRTPSQMITSVIEGFEEGVHYIKGKEVRYSSNVMLLTSEGIEFLVQGVNRQVLSSLEEGKIPEKIAA